MLALLVALYAPLHDAGAANAAPVHTAATVDALHASLADQQLCSSVEACVSTSFPPPPLLNLDQGLYRATPDQKTALRNLEKDAIDVIMSGHGLNDSDRNAVLSWGRYDALAHLYWKLTGAIDKEPAKRTDDEKQAVAWMAGIIQQQKIAASDNAGREYVKWAGFASLDDFEALLTTNPSKDTLQNFFDQNATPYNQAVTAGYCMYRSPAPYESEYQGFNDPTCYAHCPMFCMPPTPKYDSLVKWGKSYASDTWLSSDGFKKSAAATAGSLSVLVPLSAFAGRYAQSYARAVAFNSVDAALETTSTASRVARPAIGAVLRTFSAVGAASAILIVLAAILTAVLIGIEVTDADQLPGKLASLISQTRATTPDLKMLLGTDDGARSIFSIFIGASLPAPTDDICDNSQARLSPSITFKSNGILSFSGEPPCLNRTSIPSAASTDPQFAIQAKGSTVAYASPTITWKDSAAGTTTTARLKNTWFITETNGTTAQQLGITYTDWDGKQQNSWLVGNQTDGYGFLNYSPPTDPKTEVSPATCKDAKLCSTSDKINYVGADGKQYSAAVRAYTAGVGTPTYSNAVEGGRVTLDANGFKPTDDSTGEMAYQWRFQQSGCNGTCSSSIVVLVPLEPVYDPIVSVGKSTSYTWTLAGSYSVELTAWDPQGRTAKTTFTVPVANVPPTVLSAALACPDGSACVPGTAEAGSPVRLKGTVDDPGDLSNLRVTINWGDGSNYSNTSEPVPSMTINPLTLKKSGDVWAFDTSYSYPAPGTYYGSVVVTDGAGASDSETFVTNATGQGAQTITFAPIANRTYGEPSFPIAATGGLSGLPVTFAVSGDPGVCSVSNGLVSLLKTGTCAITASEAGNASFDPAEPVTRSFTVNPAPLKVTGSSPTITYPAAVPAITPVYSGFVKNETEAILDTKPACSVTVPSNKAAGTYATTCSGALDPNYVITYAPGTLTIKGAPLTVTASSGETVYTGTAPTITPSYSGFLTGDSVASLATSATCRASNPQGVVGTWQTTCFGAADPHYSFTYVPGTLTIKKASTSITLTLDQASVSQGQPVTFTAQVSVPSPGGGKPSGAVSFSDGVNSISECGVLPTLDPATLTARCTTSSLALGSRTINARHLGDNNFLGSSAPAATVTVGIATRSTTTTFSSVSPSPSFNARPVTFTVSVAVAAPNTGTPTGGTVTFFDGATSLGTGQVQVVAGKAQASLTAYSLPMGRHVITARYDGVPGFAPSTSSGGEHWVSVDPATLGRNTITGGYNIYDMPGAVLAGLYLPNSVLGGNLTDTIFVGATLTGAQLNGRQFTGADFTRARLTNARLTGGGFQGANFSRADLSGADISSANLSGATGLADAILTNVKWFNTVCPDGTNSSQNGGTCFGHL
jgi:hypothetical protein